jgi:6-phosphogluconate dehydrogenase
MNTAGTRNDQPTSSLRLGYAGLGKMGFNMVELLLEKGYGVVAFDLDEKIVREAAGKGAEPARSLEALAGALKAPRLVWLMVPHGAVDTVLDGLTPHLQKGDTVIDGGNSFFKDSIRRARSLAEKGIDFLDVGVSGGPDGARHGACIMAGGKKESFDRLEGLFRDLTVPEGYGYMGGHGAGHFVKMVHNGIEYGMMQALAEGFTVMKHSAFDLDLLRVANVYNHGSVITSRLVGWLAKAFEEHGVELRDISGSANQSGEGMWTMETAQELRIPDPVIEASVNFRTESQKKPSYTGQVVSALRNQFGHHPVSAK